MNQSKSGIRFPDTAWTQVLAGQSSDDRDSSRALEELCRQYSPAIRGYLRALGLSKEDAEDVGQEFVAGFILGAPLHRADPARGRLRSYMKQSIRNFLAKRARDAARLKRGGGVVHISLQDTEEPGTAGPPDAAYDQEWAWTVMERAISALRKRYSARGKEAVFDLIKPSLAGEDDLQSHAAIGLSVGVSESQINVEVHRARRRLAEALRREVAETVDAESNVEEELRYLLSVLTYE
ncbi:MAG: sigma-70 family RNA polymerase sigma factor [Verrucomicrobiales bacterium]